MFRRVSGSVAMMNASVAMRCVASPVVATNVKPATTSAILGSSVSAEEVASAHKVPVSIIDKVVNPAVSSFTKMDLARTKFAPLIATSKETDALHTIRASVKAAKSADPNAASSAVAGAKEKLASTQWKSMTELIQFYEEAMYPIREAHSQYLTYELNSFHIKDDLKRGLSAFKQDYLDKKKVELAEVQAKMKQKSDFIKATSAASFDTQIYNNIANILRVAGETNADAHLKAIQVLDDMTLGGIPFNSETVQILRTVTFNDGPFDHSELLFDLIKFPERGEVSISNDPLEKIADNVLKTISIRHQTPLDSGRMLRQDDTNPCLQRSPE